MRNTILLLLFFIAAMLVPQEAFSLPFFARLVGRDCTYCHIAFPKLNETGKTYRANGYRFAEDDGWLDVKNPKVIPVALEIELEAMYDRLEKPDNIDEDSDLKVEGVELITGGALGKSGRVSFLAIVGIEQTETKGGHTYFEPFASSMFLQINDLLGPKGEGRLNLKAGQWDIGLPFMGSFQKAISNKYQAEKTLDVFTSEHTAFELNGSILGEEHSFMPTHRYYLGITKEKNIDDEEKVEGWYAVYSLTFNELYNIGAIYRHGEQQDGPVDITTKKYGIAGEAELRSFVLGAGWFRSEWEHGIDLDNYLLEALYMPFERFITGARYEIIHTNGLDDATEATLMARFYITQKVHIQSEYRYGEDRDHVLGSADRSDKVRLFLVALF
ncbi:MAG: hypothetical protein HY880_06055 [Deltaproteobacteria bacterium]|nr:hypothetical protein [Deltaproteobacteria bacterium]